MFRFSIRGLLVVIAIVGVFLAALVAPSGIWPQLWQLTVYGVILSAGLASIFLPAGRREFWIGFGVFAVGFFAIEQFELRDADNRISLYLRRSIQRIGFIDATLTTTVTSDLTLPANAGGVAAAPPREQVIVEVARRRNSLINTADLFVILCIAVLGGAIGRALCASKKSDPTRQNASP